MKTIRAAVVGYGFAGRAFHCYLMGLTPEIEIVGVAARSEATRARIVADRGRNCRVYASLDEVLADPAVELVVLATPSGQHAAQAVAALEAGKHVVTDKPMALTLAECERMIDATERSGRLLSVFQNRRWDGDFLTVKQMMADGRLAPVHRIEMSWGGFGTPRGWRGEADQGGGRLYDLGTHMIDQLCLLIPDPITSVYAKLQYARPDSSVESDAMIVVGFAGGQTGVITTTNVAAIAKPRFYVTGPSGTFMKHGLDPQEAAMKAGNIDAAVDTPETFGHYSDGKVETAVPTLAGRWRSYYENITATLRGEAASAVSLSSVRRTMAVIDAAWQSSRSGDVVRCQIGPAS